MNKTITLLGSTGSIGTQSLDVARMHGYSVFGLAANSSVDKLLEQINEFHPKYVAVVNPMLMQSFLPRWPVRPMPPSCCRVPRVCASWPPWTAPTWF